MRPANESTGLVFRPRSTWRLPLGLAAVAFGLTAGAVYFLEGMPHRSEVAGSKAIAMLEHRPGGSQKLWADCDVFGSPAALKNAKARILTPSFVRQALLGALQTSAIAAQASSRNSATDEAGNRLMPVKGGAGSPSSEFVEEVLRGMSIRVEQDAVSGDNLMSLELTLVERPDAGKIVAALAERFAVEYRRFWSGEAAKAYDEATSRADEALRIYAEAAEVLDVYEEYAADLDNGPGLAADTSARPSEAHIGENPAWVELNHKLTLLRDREKAMLEIKTTAHPDVQELDERIADFRRQLDSTPRFTSAAGAYNPVREMEASANPVRPMDSTSAGKTPKFVGRNETATARKTENIAVNGSPVEAADIEKMLQSAVESAKRDYQEQMARKRELLEAAGRMPSFSVSVNQSEIAGPQLPRGSMWIVPISGFAMAVGTWAFSSGATAQSLVATIADLEPLLQIPIIGVAPAAESRNNAARRRRRRTILRWGLITLGGLTVAGYGLCLCLHFANAVL